MPVKLHSLRFENPGAPALIILHGLLGSSRNWTTIGKALQKGFDVHALDLRNHGNSPHVNSMRWSELVEDLLLYLETHGLKKVLLIGHSLGGKVSMKFACRYPERVKKLVIVDIAAKPYPPHYDAEFRAMKRVPAGALDNRREAEELLKPLVPDWGMRQFLMTNLVHGEFGLQWQINLEVLHASLQVIRQNPLAAKDVYEGPALLLSGEQSDFVNEDDIAAMQRWFPNLNRVELPKAGHNLHVDARNAFLDAVNAFI